MKLVAVMLLLSLALSSSDALYPAGSKVVVIRIDDVQDYTQTSSYADTQKMVLQYHIDHRVPALLAIIGSRFGKDPELIDQIRKGLDQKIFTLAIHGWNHMPYSAMSPSAQTNDMQYAKDHLDAIFGVQISAFVPPYSTFNDATIDAMKANHVTLISSATYVGDIPREEDGIVYIPETVTTADVDLKTDSWTAQPFDSVIRQIQDSWINYGVAVAIIHPRQFTGEDQGEAWNIYLRVIEWIWSNDGTIIRSQPPTPKTEYTLGPLLVIVGIITGMVSTLLVLVNRSARQKSGKVQQKTRAILVGIHAPPLWGGLYRRHMIRSVCMV